jgi:hypothetical protein
VYNTDGTTGTTLSFTGTSGSNAFLAKYSSTGTMLWAAKISTTTTGAVNVYGYGVATDSSGNVFVTGYSSPGALLYNSSGLTGAGLPGAGGGDCFLAKYSSTGDVVWAAQIASGAADYGYGVATDPSGNVFVTGYFSGNLTLSNSGGTANKTLTLTGAAGIDCFLAKYSSDGSSVMWVAQIAGSGQNDAGYGVATDSSGNVAVTGYYVNGSTAVFNSGATQSNVLPWTGGNDCFLAKYSSDGSLVLWAARIVGTTTSSDAGQSAAMDSSGNVFVTGVYGAALTLYNSGATQSIALAVSGSFNCFLAKYSSDGTSVIWAARIAATAGNAQGYGVATDSSGNVYVTGQYSVASLTLYNYGETQNKTLALVGNSNAFLAKYSSDGTSVLWAARITGTGVSAKGIAIDSSGNVFVTGVYGATPTLYNADGSTSVTLPFTGGTDCFVAKYNSNGYVTSTTPASSTVLVDVTYSGTTLSPYVNGSNHTTLTATTVAATGFYVGGPSNYFNGSISELLIYSNTLTTNERSIVEGYLATKWGIKSSLPTTHPFYVNQVFNRAFSPTDLPSCFLWLDASDNSTMNSTTTVTTWNDKSLFGNTMTGTATWTGTNMTFNGSTQAFSNTSFVFPYSNFSMFGVYSNTTAPASGAYMNVMYATGGYPMIGTFDVGKSVIARGVVGNTGALGGQAAVGWAAQIQGVGYDGGNAVATDSSGNVFVTGNYGAAVVVYNSAGSGTKVIQYVGGYDCFLAKYSPDGKSVLWGVRIAGTLTGIENGTAVATDPSGNVFVTGYYGSNLTLYNSGETANKTLTLTGTASCFLAKYSADGTSVMWAARITAAASTAQGYGVATDSSGNVYVTGYYTGACTLYNSGETQSKTLTVTGADVFLAKYSADGSSVMWAARITTVTSSSIPQALATDPSGNVFVAGYYGAALTLYNSGATSSKALAFTGGNDCFLAKYSSDGSSVMWAARIAGTTTSQDFINGVATDSSGNVFVTGNYGAALTLYNSGATQTVTLPSTGTNDCFLAKYSSDGSLVLWAAQIASTGADKGNAVATDSSGNVFVTGYYCAALTLYNTGGGIGASLAFVGTQNCFLAKYSSNGAVIWATRMAAASSSAAQGVATDPSGNVFVTGFYDTVALTLYNTNGTTGATLPWYATNDCFVAKYSSNGYIVGEPTSASSTVLVDATYSGTTLSPYANGVNQTALTATTAAATGIYVGGPTNYFNGSISELLVYGSSLTTTQRQQVEGYLTQKWRLGSVVSTHPYKTIPPMLSLNPAAFPPNNITLSNLSTTGAKISWGTSSTPADSYMWYFGLSNGNIARYGFASSNTYTASVSGSFGPGTYRAWVTSYTACGPVTTLYSTNSSILNTLIASGGTNQSAFVVGYNTSGSVQWGATITGGTFCYGYGVTTDGGGNVYASGYYSAAAGVYNAAGTFFVTLPLSGLYPTFFVKYTSSGNVSWATYISGGSTSYSALTSDASCNVYMVGSYTTALTAYNASNGLSGGTLSAPASTRNTFIANYTPAGSVTSLAYISGGNCIGTAITIDVSSNIYVTGSYTATATAYSTGGTPFSPTLPFSGSICGYIVKYTSLGAVSWVAYVVGGFASPWAIATDSSGNVFVTGNYSAALTAYNYDGSSGASLAITGSSCTFILKYNSSGVILWATRIVGSGYGLCVDPGGDIWVTGTYTAALTAYNAVTNTVGATLSLIGTQTAFVIKYRSAGNLWRAASIPGGYGQGVVTDSSSNAYVTGYYSNITTVTTLSNAGASTSGVASSYSLPVASSYGTSNTQFMIKYDPDGNITNVSGIIGLYPTDTSVGRVSAVKGTNVYTVGYYVSREPVVLQNAGYVYPTTAGGTVSGNGGVLVYGPYGNPVSVLPGISSYVTGNVCVDTSGNVYGAWGNSSSFTPYAYVRKYTSTGTTLWTTNINVTGSQMSWSLASIALDPAGNLYVPGNFNPNSAATLTSGSITLGPLGTGSGLFLLKYSPTGTALWGAYGSSPSGGPSILTCITDSSCNVYVAGTYNIGFNWYSSTSAFGVSVGVPSPSGFSNYHYIVKYSTNGLILWGTYIARGSNYSYPRLAVDTANNLYVTAQYIQDATAYNGSSSLLGNSFTSGYYTGALAGNNTYLVKYSSNGTVLWGTTFQGSISSSAFIVADSNDNIYVTGWYYTALLNLYSASGSGGNTGTLPAPASTFCNAFITKYTSNGAFAWAISLGTATKGDPLSIDPSGNLLLSGRGKYSSVDGSRLYTQLTGSGTGLAQTVDQYGNVYSCCTAAATGSQILTNST